MAILAQPQSSIWLTPEGRFVDSRESSAPLAGGLAHLASKLAQTAEISQSNHAPSLRRTWFVPGAVEYTFWEERKPELLCWFGRPVCVVDPMVSERTCELPTARDKSGWNQLLTDRLREAQAELTAASIARDSHAFEILIGGQSGSFFIYDWWRSARARWSGRDFDNDHSDKLKR